MTNKALSLEQPEYVTRCVNRWRSQPIDMIIIEYAGTGDPYFGGSAEDLPLGKNGDILSKPYREKDVAVFNTLGEAHLAAQSVMNRRTNSILGVAPRWR